MASDSDRLFNYLEARYPQYLALAGAATGTGLGYYYRYYPATGAYVGTQAGNVSYLVPESAVRFHGSTVRSAPLRQRVYRRIGYAQSRNHRATAAQKTVIKWLKSSL